MAVRVCSRSRALASGCPSVRALDGAHRPAQLCFRAFYGGIALARVPRVLDCNTHPPTPSTVPSCWRPQQRPRTPHGGRRRPHKPTTPLRITSLRARPRARARLQTRYCGRTPRLHAMLARTSHALALPRTATKPTQHTLQQMQLAHWRRCAHVNMRGDSRYSMYTRRGSQACRACAPVAFACPLYQRAKPCTAELSRAAVESCADLPSCKAGVETHISIWTAD
jgi:hypothetical protein